MSSALRQSTSIKLILHPGHGKCGSSSIQSFLYSNIDQLMKLGIYLPDANFRFLFESQKSAWQPEVPIWYFQQLISENNIAAFEERLYKVLDQARKKDCQAILISAENLSNQKNISKGRKIHEILAANFDRKTVIYYMRRQDDYIVSSWQQWAHKSGKTLEKHIENLLDFHQPDFLKTASFFEEIYGEKNVTVIPLNKKAFMKGTLITDFCHRAQLGISEHIDYKIRTNKSLNPYLCEILTRTPKIYQSQHDDSLKKLLTKNVRTKRILFAKNKEILDGKQRNRILSQFKYDNQILNKKYFNHLSYEDFVGPEIDIDDELTKRLEYEIENLKDIVSIQMEIIIELLKKQQEREDKSQKDISLINLKRKLKQIGKRLLRRS